ncbi:MAG: hypothetical protein RSA10_00675 [Bacilli bacterium]
MASIKVRCNNKEFLFEQAVTLEQLSLKVKDDYKRDIIVGSINNHLLDLSAKVTKDCQVDFFDVSSPAGNMAYERGLSFLFSKSVRDLLNCDVKISYTLGKGIFCEILSNNPISEVTVEKIKMRMRDLVSNAMPIDKINVSRLDAIDYYEKINQFDKASALRYISNSSISLNKLDNVLDYYYGPLPNNTKVIDKYNVKYLKDNYVVLLYPYLYDIEMELKYEKSDKLIHEILRSCKYQNDLNLNNSTDLNKLISNGNYGDIIRISESIQDNRIFQIADNISKNKNIRMILVTGPSSSGKTTTSKKLNLFLKSKGINPFVISVDDFYVNIKDRVLDKNGNPEYEKIEAIDTKLFNENIKDLLDGKEVELPKYDFVKGEKKYSGEKTKLGENDVLIIEGIHAFNKELTSSINESAKFKLYLCPLTALNIDNHNRIRSTDNRLIRRMVRDNMVRGSSATRTLGVWKDVREAEEKYVLPYENDANEILNTSLAYELGVLKTYAEPLLFSVSEDNPNYDEAIRLINLFRSILAIPSDSVPSDSIIREFIGGSCFNS